MKEIIAIILPIIGVIFGLLWGELSRWFAERRQKRQTINKVISLLLELYFLIKRITVIIQLSDSSMTEVFAAIKGKELTKEEEQMVRELLSKTLYPLISENVLNDISKIGSDYDCLLKELSCYYPVDAYRLRGRNNIGTLLQGIDTYYKNINENFPINQTEFNELTAGIKPIIQSQALQKELSDIKEEIEKLSKDLPCDERKKITRSLNYIIEHNDEEVKKQIEDIKHIIVELLKEKNLI